MERVLNIIAKMDADGAETFLMKVLRNINKNRIMFDFLVFTKETGYYDKEILSLGGRIYCAEKKSNNPLKSFYDIYRATRLNKYKAVFRLSEHSLAFFDLLAATLGGAKVRVIRSSNAASTANGRKFSLLLHHLFKPLLGLVATERVAPSTEAAIWMFGKSEVDKGRVMILKNGIEMDKFIFDSTKREKLRNEMGLSNRFVVGHVGRLSTQKNQKFLLDVFSNIKKKHHDSVLILVGRPEPGEPDIEGRIKNHAEKLAIADSIIFTGVRADIPELLMAMDVFIFPSLYEGMPNAVIEAQSTGLRCIVSDTVTREAGLTNLVEFLSLDLHPQAWADAALRNKYVYERRNMREDFIEKGYDIESTAKWLEEYFSTHLEKCAHQ